VDVDIFVVESEFLFMFRVAYGALYFSLWEEEKDCMH
jgi:hypothetical protein